METTESQVHENKEEKQGLSPGASNTNQYTSGSEHTTEDQSSSSEEDEYNSVNRNHFEVAPLQTYLFFHSIPSVLSSPLPHRNRLTGGHCSSTSRVRVLCRQKQSQNFSRLARREISHETQQNLKGFVATVAAGNCNVACVNGDQDICTT